MVYTQVACKGQVTGPKSSFFSMMDWTTYASGYRPADVTFDRCLREPYFPRASNDIRVVVSLRKLHSFNLEPAQTESLAVVTRANSRVPSECIQYISSLRTNEILWRREPTLSARGDSRLQRIQGEPEDASSSDSEQVLYMQGPQIQERIQASVNRCSICNAPMIPGTQYCDRCGATGDSRQVPEEQKEKYSADAVKRLFESVKLEWKTSGPSFRGGRSLDSQVQYRLRCVDHYKRAVQNGVEPHGDGPRQYWTSIAHRYETDALYAANLQLKDPSFDLESAKHMDATALEAIANPTVAPMSRKERKEKHENTVTLRSTQRGGHGTVPVHQHPDFGTVVRSSRGGASSSSTAKGGGKTQPSQPSGSRWSDDAWRGRWWSSWQNWSGGYSSWWQAE
jgi:hypothetical protein